MIWQSKEDLRQRVMDILFDTGYPDYALALNGFAYVKALPDGSRSIGATDYKGMFLNAKLDDDELSLVARHEILHVMLRHNNRRKSSHKHMTWNVACDYELSNYYSAYDDEVVASSELLRNGATVSDSPEYAGLVAEEIYDKLLEERKKQQKQQQEQQQDQSQDNSVTIVAMPGMPSDDSGNDPHSGGKGWGKPRTDEEEESGENEDSKQVEDAEQEESEESQGEGQGEQEGAEEKTKQEEQADGEGEQPDLSDEELAEQLEKELSELAAELSDLSDDEQEELYNKIKQAIEYNYDSLSPEQKSQMAASELVEASGISGIGGKDVGLAPIAEPPIPDAQKLFYSLRSFFIKQENVDKGRSYRRPNKKYAGSGIIMKGRSNVYKPTKTLAVYVDISGSMTKEKVAKALGVVETMEKMKRVTLVKHYFDTRIHDKFRPGGGTDYNCIFRHARENNYTCIAIITDDTDECFQEEFSVEALWIAGVEPKRARYRKGYSFEERVNKPDGNITAKKFEVAIVEQD